MLLGPCIAFPPPSVGHAYCPTTGVDDNLGWMIQIAESFCLVGCFVPHPWWVLIGDVNIWCKDLHTLCPLLYVHLHVTTQISLFSISKSFRPDSWPLSHTNHTNYEPYIFSPLATYPSVQNGQWSMLLEILLIGRNFLTTAFQGSPE